MTSSTGYSSVWKSLLTDAGNAPVRSVSSVPNATIATEVRVSIPGVWATAEQRKTGKLSDGPGSVSIGTVLDRSIPIEYLAGVVASATVSFLRDPDYSLSSSHGVQTAHYGRTAREYPVLDCSGRKSVSKNPETSRYTPCLDGICEITGTPRVQPGIGTDHSGDNVTIEICRQRSATIRIRYRPSKEPRRNGRRIYSI
jgi:hypothetical protein